MATITVEKQLCVGHGMCEAVRPDLMQLGDEGFGEVIAQPADGDDLEALIDACPARALSVQE